MRIYHTSDVHDHRHIAQPLLRLRSANPGLYFDCGDCLRGSQTVYHRDEPIIAQLDEARVDAQAIGNREFHYLFGLLRARAAKMHHPLVCSNLVDTKNRALPFLDHLRFQTPNGNVYLAGLLVPQYPVGSFWERVFGWRFLEPVATIASHARRVRDDEAFIILSHIGLPYDRKLAAAVPRIDLLLGGHSHDTLRKPQIVAGVPIVHAGPYGAFASRTQLERNSQTGRYSMTDFRLETLHA